MRRLRDWVSGMTDSLAPGEHAWYRLNVNEIDSIGEIIEQIVRERGKLDGMVYAAGIGGTIPLPFLTYEKLLTVFQTNYFGFVECVRQVCKKGRYNTGMRIVGVSSIASLLGNEAHTAYSASKAAMDASIRCLAKELARKGICINSVAPGWTRTEMFEEFLIQQGEDNPTLKKDLQRQYLGLGEPGDIANAICFLLSPEARFITGITLPVDGGWTSSD